MPRPRITYEEQLRRITSFVKERFGDGQDPSWITDGYWHMIERLSATDRKQAFNQGLEFLKATDARTRYIGSSILQNFFNPLQPGESRLASQGRKELIKAARTETSWTVLEGLIFALDKTRHPSCLPVFLSYAEHPSVDVRTAVAQSLSSALEDISPEAISTIIKMTTDHDPDVRDWSVFTLGTQLHTYEIDSKEIRDALFARIRDRHHDTRGEAIIGLAYRHDERAVPELIRRFNLAWTNNGSLQAIELEAAGLYGLPEFYPYLTWVAEWWGEEPRLEWAIKRCNPDPKVRASVPEELF